MPCVATVCIARVDCDFPFRLDAAKTGGDLTDTAGDIIENRSDDGHGVLTCLTREP